MHQQQQQQKVFRFFIVQRNRLSYRDKHSFAKIKTSRKLYNGARVRQRERE